MVNWGRHKSNSPVFWWSLILWPRNRITIEYLGIWEKINNPNFNYPDWKGRRSESIDNVRRANATASTLNLLIIEFLLFIRIQQSFKNMKTQYIVWTAKYWGQPPRLINFINKINENQSFSLFSVESNLYDK